MILKYRYIIKKGIKIMKKLKRLEHESLPHKSKSTHYEFGVIGAGPAGILAVAALLKKASLMRQFYG